MVTEAKPDVRGKDICTNCGRLVPGKAWGGDCTCSFPNTMHLKKCSYCNKEWVGYIIDDDYCKLERAICSLCLRETFNLRGLEL